MEPVVIVRKPEEDETKRVDKILLSKMGDRIEREEQVKNSFLEIIVCQMNSLLFDILNQCELKIVALRINDSLKENVVPYHWEKVFLFAVPKKCAYNKIKKLFSEVRFSGAGGWYIPDELSEWYTVIHFYDKWSINISISSEGEKYEMITEKIKTVFKGNRKIRIS